MSDGPPLNPPPDVVIPDPIPTDPIIPPDQTPPPITQVQAQISDGLVLATGHFPSGSPDPATITIVDITDQAEADKLSEPGLKYLDLETGVITVTPPGIDYAWSAELRRRAEATAQAELLALENPDYLVILKASGGI